MGLAHFYAIKRDGRTLLTTTPDSEFINKYFKFLSSTEEHNIVVYTLSSVVPINTITKENSVVEEYKFETSAVYFWLNRCINFDE